ncbi:SulP family inorganic anion transporter [Streptomyces sp. NBC_00986]|uniref:SulP family inorganic anion transporter n=1 Tax=Streptomyces sp. NBC_00986 TaxID=2903702 RepID=UPI0038700DFB|nr:SulP family inorganic anion transporter [Streptomyces sp. NBC_00986]
MRCGVSKAELFASLVVFLVALPLCVGVAIASGVPAESGLVTGIVGGLVVGVLRLGRWFRAVPSAVVHGMLAGIGLVLVAGQVYALGDVAAPAGAVGKLAGLVSLPGVVDPVALSVGGATLAVLLLWPRWGWGARLVPAPLVAVGLAAAVTGGFDLAVRRVEVRGLVGAVRVPGWGDFGRLTEVGVIGTVVAFAVIASAGSLFGVAAVDRLRRGPRADYDRELSAQGVGNAVCGVLGALPMTPVGVRSVVGGVPSEGVRAGARAKASRVLRGGWLLVFAALVPGVLGVVPVAALAGVLVHAGCGLVPVRQVRGLWRGYRGEVVVLGVTAGVIVVGSLFEGVLVGLALAVAKTAWDVSHVRVETEDLGDAGIVVRVRGHATFLRLPRLLEALEVLPGDRVVRLELGGLRHVDHACAAALEGWVVGRGRGEGVTALRGG